MSVIIKKNLLRAYRADVLYTPASEGSDGAIRIAQKVYSENSDIYFFANQYGNPENWRAHYRTTALEIWWQTRGKLTHFVAGLGTSGTFMGTGRRLRKLNAEIQLISMQPDSPFHGLEGLKHMPSAIIPGIYDDKLADKNVEVQTETAQELVRHMARKKGILAGLSSGAALAAARHVSAKIKEGIIVTVFPDGGQRYIEDNFWNVE